MKVSEFLKSVEKNYGVGKSSAKKESMAFRIEDVNVDNYEDGLATSENYFDIANSASDIPLLGSLSKLKR